MMRAYLFLSLLLFYGCTPQHPEEDLVRKVVGRYNNALVEAYRNQLFGALEEVSSEAEARKVRIIVSSYLQGGEIMEAELHAMDFKEVKAENDNAIAKTSEDWSYRWINYATGEEAEPRNNIHYEMLYHLIKKDGRWLVDKAEEIKTEEDASTPPSS